MGWPWEGRLHSSPGWKQKGLESQAKQRPAMESNGETMTDFKQGGEMIKYAATLRCSQVGTLIFLKNPSYSHASHSFLSLLRFSAPTFLLLLDLDRTLNLDGKYQLCTPDIVLFMLSLNVTYWKNWNMTLLVNKKMFLWLILMDLIFLQKEFWNE